ncbi:hypothetical protein SAMN05216285_1515 [Natrinema salifodinae]|uniref:Uncharacterized protein n=1 Tax=Natrinema salifodinae TaxID=1202768 RepID=A0A1I0NAI4_9EURY|nr:hypothetical protein SAMN05216285_1515 [Natrinema salifodinae]
MKRKVTEAELEQIELELLEIKRARATCEEE